MKKAVILAFMVGFSFSLVAQKGISFEQGSWNQVLAKAKKENKLIFMDAYTTWCGPCKLLQARVFPDAELGSHFNDNFINYKVDMEKGEGPMLGMKYPLKGYPTLFFIDPKSEKVVEAVLGYRSAEQLLAIGKKHAKTKS